MEKPLDSINMRFLVLPILSRIRYDRSIQICGWGRPSLLATNTVTNFLCAFVFLKKKDDCSGVTLAKQEFCASDRDPRHQIAASIVSAFRYINFKQSYNFMIFVIFLQGDIGGAVTGRANELFGIIVRRTNSETIILNLSSRMEAIKIMISEGLRPGSKRKDTVSAKKAKQN